MRTPKIYSFILVITVIVSLFIISCNGPSAHEEKKAISQDEMVARGKYLVTGSSCNDCHSPKVFGPMGPEVDTTKILSGHPVAGPPLHLDTNTLHPGYGYMSSADLTAWSGPWGISYTANLTPDSATGIGAWTEENFINALRKGKHLGMDGGRPIMPPMPWFMVNKYNDEDLKSIFAYLKSLPPISNPVPAPIPPPDVVKMAMAPPPAPPAQP